MTRKKILAIALGTILMSACGTSNDVAASDELTSTPATTSTSIDYRAWSSDMRELGFIDIDYAALEKLVREECDATVDDLKLFLAAGRDEGSDPEVLRVSFRHVCPEELPRLEDASASLDDDVDTVEEACSTPAEGRTEEQQMLAEAMAC